MVLEGQTSFFRVPPIPPPRLDKSFARLARANINVRRGRQNQGRRNKTNYAGVIIHYTCRTNRYALNKPTMQSCSPSITAKSTSRRVVSSAVISCDARTVRTSSTVCHSSLTSGKMPWESSGVARRARYLLAVGDTRFDRQGDEIRATRQFDDIVTPMFFWCAVLFSYMENS